MTAVHEEQVTKGKNPKLFLQLFPKELINLSSLIYARLDAFSPSLSAGRMSMFWLREASIVAKDRLHDNSRSMSKLDEIKQTKKILIS